MKKKIILFLIIMMLGMIKVNAAERVMGFYHIKTSSFEINTVAREKTTYSVPKVKAQQVSTSLNDPCSSCYLLLRMYRGTDFFALGSTIKLGQEKSFVGHDGSASPGTFNLAAMRADFTLLETKAKIKWIYD